MPEYSMVMHMARRIGQVAFYNPPQSDSVGQVHSPMYGSLVIITFHNPFAHWSIQLSRVALAVSARSTGQLVMITFRNPSNTRSFEISMGDTNEPHNSSLNFHN
jgi:hypothetical protein